MNEALCSILCDQEDYWRWSPYSSYMIQFNSDGTGELWCMQALTYLFAVNFDWKSLSHIQPAAEPRSTWVSGPQVLGKLRLEITLHKSIAKSMVGATSSRETMRGLHDKYLLEGAWRPKAFLVRIEKGNFRAPDGIGSHKLQYGLRLVFDKSPFPPLEEWNINGGTFVPPVGPADEKQPPVLEFVNLSLGAVSEERCVVS